ncbi:ABC transporter ATP-binding protein [Streptomyces zagrosensis]|uniref:Iron complex transport system ATP-binding protein n=1 Tax=Streptomyces zagrosensis TaxID=1042984 RepID=A0A7W9V049_9ACTN|nr:ATP-binding cassette domain-containing protein [Streptomyces zagrosensis]MBB5936961.1 iron complex transport system ATP-binding protein [Streptomyces zagrosensis]
MTSGTKRVREVATGSPGAPGGGSNSAAVACLNAVAVRRPTTGQVILDDINWAIHPGEHWALLGANGAGKTTVLRLIGALMHPTSGTVDVLGHRLGQVDVRGLRARIGLVSSAQKVPQDATGLTVALTGATGTVQPLWRSYDDATRERAGALLAELGCKELADRPYGVCSGGQRARILIARALMADPGAESGRPNCQLLLLDEPFNALDLPSREDLIDTMRQLADARPHLATVTVTHHLEELSPSIGHALLLRDGRVQAQGPAPDVLTDAGLTACFGRPIEVSQHAGRWLARSASFGPADTA